MWIIQRITITHNTLNANSHKDHIVHKIINKIFFFRHRPYKMKANVVIIEYDFMVMSIWN